ncbi:MAG: hypothetical protein HKN76_01560 [Saprospiraceae bacterium]|nr:hypothetical protein [Saprospiraceae bacterium]
MANRTIAILRSDPDPIDPSNSRLTLSDNGVTFVDPGDVVTWIIDKDCEKITSIFIHDDARFDLFDPDPAPVSGSTRWTGVINPKTAEKIQAKNSGKPPEPIVEGENYTIYWSEEGRIYSFDPIIQINPKT